MSTDICLDNGMPPRPSPSSTGPDFPGAYPNEDGEHTSLNVAPSAAKPAVLNASNSLPSQEVKSALNTAREYLPNQDDLRNATDNVVNIARQYLPEGVAAYLPGTTSISTSTSLPSTGKSGAQPGEHSDGVGALPGSISESKVALLPEERRAADEITSSTSPVGGLKATVAGLGDTCDIGESQREKGKNLPSETKMFPVVKGEKRPRGTGQGGIGTLSWAGSETSLAKLPEERLDNRQVSTGSELTVGDTKDTKKASESEPKTDPSSEEESLVAIAALDASESQDLLPPHLQQRTEVGRTERDTGPDKPKLMDRVKGELKVVAGKLGRDESRVAQGRRMMGKD